MIGKTFCYVVHSLDYGRRTVNVAIWILRVSKRKCQKYMRIEIENKNTSRD